MLSRPFLTFFILLSVSQSLPAIVLPTIAELCRGTSSKITKNEVLILKDQLLFPRPNESLGKFIDHIDNWRNWTGRRANTCGRDDSFDRFAKVPTVLQEVLGDLSKEIKVSIAQDIEAQRVRLNSLQVCSEIMVQQKNHQAQASWTLREFIQQKNREPSDEECQAIANELLPELQQRFALMREMLAIANPPQRADQPLRHDQSFAADLGSTFFPNVWKQDSATYLVPLTSAESTAVQDLARSTPPSLALKRYYQILSTTNILFFFDRAPDPASLNRAAKEMIQQNKFDLEAFRASPPQEIFLLGPYVASALQALAKESPERLGDACFVVNEIKANFTIQAKIRRGAALVGILLALEGGLAAQGLKEAVILGFQRAGVVLPAITASMSLETFHKYTEAMKLCSAVAVEDVAIPSQAGLCDFQKADRLADDNKLNLAMPFISSTVVGGLRMIKMAKSLN